MNIMHICILGAWLIELGMYIGYWLIGESIHPALCILMCGTGIFGCLECISMRHTVDRFRRADSVAYICDGKECSDGCSYPECRHTCSIDHAKNFKRVGEGKWMEVE